jgi:hypothetical protein
LGSPVLFSLIFSILCAIILYVILINGSLVASIIFQRPDLLRICAPILLSRANSLAPDHSNNCSALSNNLDSTQSNNLHSANTNYNSHRPANNEYISLRTEYVYQDNGTDYLDHKSHQTVTVESHPLRATSYEMPTPLNPPPLFLQCMGVASRYGR